MTDHSQFKLGRKPAVTDPRIPHLSKHMRMVQPKPAVDWSGPVKDWGMLGNDIAGDCTCAAVLHQMLVWEANNDSSWAPTTAEALDLYSAITGYPAQDEGAVEADVLRYWATNGVQGGNGLDTIAYAALNPRNLDELRLTVENFGGVYLGLALPLTAQTQSVFDVTSAGLAGDGAPGSWGGHAVIAVAYDVDSWQLVTWGKLMKATNAWMLAYLEEAWAVVSSDWLAKSGISPSGLDMAALMADMQSITA
jgi:hypothetical protein